MYQTQVRYEQPEVYRDSGMPIGIHNLPTTVKEHNGIQAPAYNPFRSGEYIEPMYCGDNNNKNNDKKDDDNPDPLIVAIIKSILTPPPKKKNTWKEQYKQGDNTDKTSWR